MKKALALVLAVVMSFAIFSTVFAIDFDMTIQPQNDTNIKTEKSFLRDESHVRDSEPQNGFEMNFDTKVNGTFYGGFFSWATNMEGNIIYDLGTDTIEYLSGFSGSMFASEYIATTGETYGVYTFDDKLFTLARFDDFENSVYTDIATAPEQLIGMSMDYTTNTLYGIGISQTIYTIDYTTGTFTPIAYLSGTDDMVIVMTIDTLGNMYVISFNGIMYSVDKDTGSTTLIGGTGLFPNFAQSLVFDHDTQIMYWFYYDGGYGAVYTVDPATATVTPAGSADRVEIYGVHTRATTVEHPDPVPAEGVMITPEVAELIGGQTLQLRVTVLPANAYVEDRSVTWTSSDDSIATVNENGLVTAIGSGNVTITATTNDGNFTDTCEITVISAQEYYRDLSEALNVASFGEDGYYTYATGTDYPFTVVDVDGRGAVGQSTNVGVDRSVSYVESYLPVRVIAGSVITFDWAIDVASEEYFDMALFYVNDTVITGISGTTDWQSYQYTIPVTSDFTFRWEYIKDDMNSDGQDMLWLDNINLEMNEVAPLESITLNPSEVLVMPGMSTQLSVTFEPVNIADSTVTFASSDTSVATVTPDGLVVAVSEGVATITATAAEGGLTDTATIMVSDALSIPEMNFIPANYGDVFNVTLGSLDSQYVLWDDGYIRHTVGYSLNMGEGEGALLTVTPGENAPYATNIFIYDENFNLVLASDNMQHEITYPEEKFLPETLGLYYIVVTTFGDITLYEGDIVFSIEYYQPVHATGITVTPETLHVGRGRYAQLIGNIEPANCDFPEIIWESSDESVVIVSDRGLLYGISDGSATITATVLDGGFTDTVDITVGDPIIPEYDDTIYAYNIHDMASVYETGFIAFDPEGSAEDIMTIMPGSTNYYSGTYANGLFYGYEYENMGFYTITSYHIIDPVTFTLQSSIPCDTTLPVDMTYDFSTNTMYGNIANMNTGDNYLGIIDPETGAITEVAPFDLEEGATMQTLAAINNGDLYAIDNNGMLYYINKYNASVVAIADMGFEAQYVQTMVYDNYREEMYWFQMDEDSSELVVFDPTTGDIIATDMIGSGCTEITSAFIYADPDTFPEPAAPIPVEGVTVDPTEITIGVGFTENLNAVITPINASNKNVTWMSTHPGIVTVDTRGNITGVHPGSAYVIATTEDGGFTAGSLVTVTDIADSDIPQGMVKVTLKAGNVWGDGTGYQMLLDSDANAFENGIIPADGPLSNSGDVPPEVYAEFEYTIPEGADGALNTGNIVFNDEVSIFIEPGVYDWCITNPAPGSAMWIAGNGRADNYEFEAGYSYVFEVYFNIYSDDVRQSSEYMGFYNPNPADTFSVTFVNYDDTLIAVYETLPGEDAIAPSDPVHPDGYEFIGWDTDFTNVQSDLTVKALFNEIESPYDIGDVNMDNVVNTGDAALVLRYAVELATLSDEQLTLADYNADGKVDTGDAAGILRFAVGL